MGSEHMMGFSHGHVRRNGIGVLASCGGPAACAECAAELEDLKRELSTRAPKSVPVEDWARYARLGIEPYASQRRAA